MSKKGKKKKKVIRNFVAKHAHQFNHAAVHKNKKKYDRKKAKQKGFDE